MKASSNSWYDELVNATQLLYKADKTSLDRLNLESSLFNRLATDCLNKTDIPYKNATYLVDILKQKYSKEADELDDHFLDYDDIKAKISLLKGLCIDVETGANGTKPLTFKFNVSRVNRDNESWALILVSYIQSVNGLQTNEAFARKFVELTNPLKEIASQSSAYKESNIITEQPSKPSRNNILILVFGQSHKNIINDIINKKHQLDDNDYELLENKCEWFWYGPDSDKPIEINKDESDNMCWLQMDVQFSDVVQVKNLLHLKDLIKKIRKKPDMLLQIRSSSKATFNLDNKEFIKS